MDRRDFFVGVAGGSQCPPDIYQLAEELGTKLADVGAVVVCGGRGGVMEAAAKGAQAGGGIAIGILPGFSRSEANPFIQYPICTGLGQARNLLVVLNSNVLIAVGGEFGTLSEIALALKHGIPVIGLRSWGIEKLFDNAEEQGFYPVATAAEAVSLAQTIKVSAAAIAPVSE